MSYSTLATILGTAALGLLKNRGSKVKLRPMVDLDYHKRDLWQFRRGDSEWKDRILKKLIKKTIDQIVVDVSKRYPNLTIKSELSEIRGDSIHVITDIKERVSFLSEIVKNSNVINIDDGDDEYWNIWMQDPDPLTKSIVNAGAEIDIGIENALNLDWYNSQLDASAKVVLVSENGEVYKPVKNQKPKLRKA
jgi:hypothetical protein